MPVVLSVSIYIYAKKEYFMKQSRIEKTAEITKDTLSLGNPDALIFFMSVGTMFWGAWLMAPWNVFQATTNFVLLDGSLFPEFVWGFIFFVAGLLKFITWANHHFSGRVHMAHVIMNFVLFFLWGVVAGSVIMENWHSTGTPVYTFFSIASLWATSVRLAQLRVQKKRDEGDLNGRQ